MSESIAVVGASLAGLTVVRSLRARGFRGRITLIGAEPELPYERPTLSKEFLQTGEPVGLLEGHAETRSLDAEWILGQRAVGLSTGPTHVVRLDDGRDISADIVVLATGARPRRLPGFETAHYLRDLRDARRLRAALANTTRLAIVGASFLGSEIAATAHESGIEVTLIEQAPLPSIGVLGETVAAACTALHARHGVRLHTGTSVLAHRDGVLELSDGTGVPADTVVVAIGAEPETDWATADETIRSATHLHADNGFLTGPTGRTTVPGVYAIGDCARPLDPSTGRHRRTEHWHNAITQAHLAAATITGTPAPPPAVPYFWSRQYGHLLQFAGTPHPAAVPHLIDGDLSSPTFTVRYDLDHTPVAVCALDNPRLFTRHRKLLDRSICSAEGSEQRIAG